MPNTTRSKKPQVDLHGNPRRVAVCMNCGETNEMAAHGMCFRCYRRLQRERERQQIVRQVDRHTAALRKEHKKIFRGFAQVMSGLSDLGVPEQDVLRVRAMLEPYIAPIKLYLGGPPPAPDFWADVPRDTDAGSETSDSTEPDEDREQ